MIRISFLSCFSALRHVFLIRGFIESSTRSAVLQIQQQQGVPKFENKFYTNTVATVVLGLDNWLVNCEKTILILRNVVSLNVMSGTLLVISIPITLYGVTCRTIVFFVVTAVQT